MTASLGKSRPSKSKAFLPGAPKKIRRPDGSIVGVSRDVFKIMLNDQRRAAAGRWFSGRPDILSRQGMAPTPAPDVAEASAQDDTVASPDVERDWSEDTEMAS